MNNLFSTQRIGQILIEKGFANSDQIESALTNGTGLIGQRLIKSNIISSKQLGKALAEQAKLKYISLTNHVLAPDLVMILGKDFIYRQQVLPISLTDKKLFIAISDPFDLDKISAIQQKSKHPIELLISAPESINAVLDNSKISSESINEVSEDIELAIVIETEDGNEAVVTLDKDHIENTDSPIIKLINSILIDAIQKRSSDIHIETYESNMLIKYRIDGVLYLAADNIINQHHSALISRLKVMAELDIAEKRIPQDGRFKLRYQGRGIDCRISILPSMFGEDVVIRILDELAVADGIENISLEKIGIGLSTLKKFKRTILEPYGMVLIAGPTGSGKTTTLYAALSELNNGEDKIITIEDPVEYQLDGIVQIPVNEKKGLTFAKGLRSILRHDPDKILVGEIRDMETAQITVQSAMTGHLVLSTVHANNAIDVISRFSHMGIDLYNFVSALNSVMAQRLIRKICTHCRQKITLDKDKLTESGLDPEKHADNIFYEGNGCSKCNNTGYNGRTVITEFLEITTELREMILRRESASELMNMARTQGMQTLRESAVELVLTGVTTIKEANRVTFIN